MAKLFSSVAGKPVLKWVLFNLVVVLIWLLVVFLKGD
jgi:hypothetical protein